MSEYIRATSPSPVLVASPTDTMGKGFYISKLVAFVTIFFAIAAVATIIALAVVYSNEISNNKKEENGGPTSAAPQGTSSTTGTGTGTGTTTTTKPTTPASNELWDQYRLPKSLIPDHYDVDLRPVLEKNAQGLFVFHGKSVAHFRCNEITNVVIIHSNKLNYSSCVLQDDAGKNLTISKQETVVRTNYLVLHLAENLQTGKTYRLHTEFIGELADDLAGFYRSEYVEDGVTK